ncbi:LysR family transcriptional regulator [Bradyrhizobium sp. RDT46]|uniref:helix-turn-helix domain-containing protein n=1 Tax=Bradyrhizobium sp. RDT46 TaxID=3341829 RepID=UPI0035C68A5E
MASHPIPDLSAFVRTIDLGSFAAVGAEAGLTASGVSRIVSRLERRLGVALSAPDDPAARPDAGRGNVSCPRAKHSGGSRGRRG